MICSFPTLIWHRAERIVALRKCGFEEGLRAQSMCPTTIEFGRCRRSGLSSRGAAARFHVDVCTNDPRLQSKFDSGCSHLTSRNYSVICEQSVDPPIPNFPPMLPAQTPGSRRLRVIHLVRDFLQDGRRDGLTSPINTRNSIVANGPEAHSAVHPVIRLISRQTGPRESTYPKKVIFGFYNRQSPPCQTCRRGFAPAGIGTGPNP
jgi:hypothetical protein